MTLDEEIAALMAEHKGVRIGGESGITIRPLSMDDIGVCGPDLVAVFKTLLAGAERIKMLLADDAVADAAGEAGGGAGMEAIADLLTPVLPALRNLLARCVDKPLGQLPLALTPLLLQRFIVQNFSNPHLTLWVGPLQDLAAMARVGKSGALTSATPGSSCSTTDTPAPGATPAASSSSGAGAS